MSTDDLEFEFSIKPILQETLGDYVLAFSGTARIWDDQTGEERVVGEINGYRVDLASAVNDGMHISDLCDSISAEISAFAAVSLRGKRCMTGLGAADGHDFEPEGLIYINALLVDPQFRGEGVGSALLRRMSHMIDINHCLIALKAHPILERLDQEVSREDIERVKGFYQRLGFRPLAGHFMVKDFRFCDAMLRRTAGVRGGRSKPLSQPTV